MKGVFGIGVANTLQKINGIYDKIGAIYGCSAGAMNEGYFKLKKRNNRTSSTKFYWEVPPKRYFVIILRTFFFSPQTTTTARFKLL